MRLEDYFDFIQPDVIRLKGHRLGIEDILVLYDEGYTPEQISLEYPGLELEKIYATITYYWHNKQMVDDYLKRLDKLVADSVARQAKQTQPDVVQRIRKLQQTYVEATMVFPKSEVICS